MPLLWIFPHTCLTGCSLCCAQCSSKVNTRKYDHVTPLLQELHWLSDPERIKFRLAVLVLRCRSHTAPAYLVRDLHHWAANNNSRQRLRSSACTTDEGVASVATHKLYCIKGALALVVLVSFSGYVC